MKILISLTYYRPYTSGVIVYSQRLAEALAEKGHEVTVLTSRYSRSLPRQERANGVEIRRVSAPIRIHKGVLMPTFPWTAFRMLQSHDSVIFHLPNTPIEALFVPLLSKWLRKPVVGVYHCDVVLSQGVFNRMVEGVVRVSNFLAGKLADRIVGYTDDYSAASPFLVCFKRKLEMIYPPVAIPLPDPAALEEFRTPHAPEGQPLIGFAGRLATEKGVEYLMEAFELVRERIPNARVIFAGESEGVIGERNYANRLKPLILVFGDQWRFLGTQEPSCMSVFYTACSVLVLPSVNRTESFGLVQVESMLCGTPVIASDLPGVRVPLQITGMGRIIPARESGALAEAILEVLKNRDRYVRPRAEIEKVFSLEDTIERFESLLRELKDSK